ncbi:MAG: ArsR/SmtB family transcription factor [Nitrospira sp.]
MEILKELNDGECCVCEVTDTLQAGQSRLSFHLKVLKEAGLIRDRRDGRWMYYRVNAEALNELEESLIRSNRPGGRAGLRAAVDFLCHIHQ